MATAPNLRSTLEHEVKGWESLSQIQNHDAKHLTLLPRFFLKHGVAFDARPKPKGYRLGTIKQCYKNSTHLVLQRPDELRYFEGYYRRPHFPLAIQHAWCVDKEDQVVDVTLRHPEGGEYLGIHIPQEKLESTIIQSNVYGVIWLGWTVNIGLLREIDEPLVIECIGKAAADNWRMPR